MHTGQSKPRLSTRLLCSLSALVLAIPLALQAGPVSGPKGKALFQQYRDNHGGQFIDFTYGVAPIPADRRLDTEFLATHGVKFETFLDPNKNPIGPHNVYVSQFNAALTNTIVGTPCVGCSDDGRYSYRIVFTNPQRYAGAQRIWNTSTKTEFYAPGGGLLHEVVNSVNSEFHGYQADSADTSTWVSTIVVTWHAGQQVGYTDDLFFGIDGPKDKDCNFIVVPTKKGGAMAGCL